jgi:predicted RNA-binding protein
MYATALKPWAIQMRYFIGVASREHVRVGVRSGFAQFSHGKLGPAKRLSNGDWIIYYSANEKYGGMIACQKFTAIGQVVDTAARQVEQTSRFKPWRRKVKYRRAKEVEIHSLLKQLSFIKNKDRWGATFRFGFLEIGESDFYLIARRMLPSQAI